MASKRDKLLMGGLLTVSAIAIGAYLVLPSFETMMKNFGKIAESELKVAALDSQIQSVEEATVKLKKLKELPEGLIVREFQPNTLQKNVKQMVDQVVSLSTDNGNDLISLEPWEAPAPPAPPPKLDEEGNPIPDNSPKLQTYGYELTVRGAYDSVLAFLGSMNNHHELIELKSIQIENEAGEERVDGAKSPFINPFKPIKLTSKLVLFLQPKL